MMQRSLVLARILPTNTITTVQSTVDILSQGYGGIKSSDRSFFIGQIVIGSTAPESFITIRFFILPLNTPEGPGRTHTHDVWDSFITQGSVRDGCKADSVKRYRGSAVDDHRSRSKYGKRFFKTVILFTFGTNLYHT
jgi:hypothetical protein